MVLHVGLTSFWLLVILPAVLTFDLTILHTNDVHARLEQTNKRSGQCKPEDAADGECYGGMARLKTKISELRASHPNTLLLDAGDQYSGTLFFYKFAGLIISRFMNILGYDAMALGNHEFDRGISGLIPFLDNVTFPVLSANIQHDDQSQIRDKIARSHVFTVGGQKIGVIGYTTKDTPAVSRPGPHLTFSDEVAAIQEETDTLTQQGVNKIIAVGHSGFTIDKRIAAEVTGLDLVIGGHTNTFLYTGSEPSIEEPVGEYPHVITQAGGGKVLVVQDYAYGKYLGVLHVTFNDAGDVTSWSGNPVLLDNNTAEDPSTLAVLQPYTDLLAEEAFKFIGRSHVFLEGSREICRRQECNLGNLVTDSMVRQNLRQPDSLEWSNVAIAIMNAGGIRTSIEKGDVTLGQCATVLPFSNTLDIVELYGRHLVETLEHAIASYGQEKPPGEFMQVAGMKVVYNVSRPVGSRVVSARAKCTACQVPVYEDVVPDQVYQVVMPSFIADGGDDYSMIADNKIKHHLVGNLDLDAFVEYVTQYSPIIHGIEERIVFTSDEDQCPALAPPDTTPADSCPVCPDVNGCEVGSAAIPRGSCSVIVPVIVTLLLRVKAYL